MPLWTLFLSVSTGMGRGCKSTKKHHTPFCMFIQGGSREGRVVWVDDPRFDQSRRHWAGLPFHPSPRLRGASDSVHSGPPFRPRTYFEPTFGPNERPDSPGAIHMPWETTTTNKQTEVNCGKNKSFQPHAGQTKLGSYSHCLFASDCRVSMTTMMVVFDKGPRPCNLVCVECPAQMPSP